MGVNTVYTDVFIAEFDGEPYAFGLTEADARPAAEGSFRFGDRAETRGCLGNQWATRPSDTGWRIVKRTRSVALIDAERRGAAGETCHVCWQCPYCQEWYSDDVEHDQAGPLLTSCGRTYHHANGEDVWAVLNW